MFVDSLNMEISNHPVDYNKGSAQAVGMELRGLVRRIYEHTKNIVVGEGKKDKKRFE